MRPRRFSDNIGGSKEELNRARLDIAATDMGMQISAEKSEVVTAKDEPPLQKLDGVEMASTVQDVHLQEVK